MILIHGKKSHSKTFGLGTNVSNAWIIQVWPKEHPWTLKATELCTQVVLIWTISYQGNNDKYNCAALSHNPHHFLSFIMLLKLFMNYKPVVSSHASELINNLLADQGINGFKNLTMV